MMKIADNTISAVKKYFHLQLDELWDAREVDLFFDEVFYQMKGYERLELRMNESERLSESELVRIIHIVKQLKQKKPIQQILGKASFLRFDLFVNEHTLIPRPETEELVNFVIEKTNNSTTVVDIGTGSGCIALGLKDQWPQAQVIGIDVSQKALDVAKRNSDHYELDIDWKLGDILGDISKLPQAQCIVSNPPYIPRADAQTMEDHVVDYEPHLALFTPDEDDLIFYRALANYAKLNKAELFVETHADRGSEVLQLFHTLEGRNCDLKQDLSGRDRMVYASWQELV